MRKRVGITFLMLGLLAFGPTPIPGSAEGQKPFYKAREKQTGYEGPGRDDPEPMDLKEVLIGYFGPAGPAHLEGGDIWLAVNLAVEEANAVGGYRGLPFRLVPGWSENPWGNGVNQVTRMAFVDRVWALIGGIDGPSTHLAEQVVAKAHLTLISPASTDKSVNLANVPWMFSALPGDHLLAPVLGHALLEEVGNGAFVLASATDHDSHQFLIELEKYLAKQHAAPWHRFEFESGRQDHSDLVRQALAERPRAVVLIAGASGSASLVNALRERGFTGRIFGGPAMGRRLFRDRLMAEAGGIFFPMVTAVLDNPDKFAHDFAARFCISPDYAARYAYESTCLLLAAIRKAGLNRARIGDAVRALSPWNGTAAWIEWDSLGQNRGRITLGSISSAGCAGAMHTRKSAP